MSCTDYGQLGCSGKCDHPWDGKPGSCPQPGATQGQVGGGCLGWPSSACGAGGKCVDGTCLACGGDGQLCCDQYSPNPSPCSAGTCQATGDWPTCNDSCGTLTPGKDTCCAGTGTKCSEGACDIDTNKCIQPASDPCTGQLPYSIYLKDAFGCAVGPIYFSANNDAEAKTCADALKAQYGAAGECSLNQGVQETDVCETSFLGQFPDIVDVCDQADFSACEQSKCTNCTFTNGSCP